MKNMLLKIIHAERDDSRRGLTCFLAYSHRYINNKVVDFQLQRCEFMDYLASIGTVGRGLAPAVRSGNMTYDTDGERPPPPYGVSAKINGFTRQSRPRQDAT